MIHDNTLLEKIAALEHEQWITWAKSILSTEEISNERADRWSKYFIPYEELSDDIKEHDRVWARKVLEIINNS